MSSNTVLMSNTVLTSSNMSRLDYRTRISILDRLGFPGCHKTSDCILR